MSAKRPARITIICIIGFIGALVAIPIIFSDLAKSIGPWYPPCLALNSMMGLICMIGLWNMKKWGLILYTIFFVINSIVLFATGLWHPVGALIVPIIFIAIGFSKFKEMI